MKNVQNLLKFGTFDISNIQISILMWKMIFIKYLSSVGPKLIPKLKVPRIYWDLAHLIFQISDLDFNVKNDFLIKYLPIARSKMVPKWKTLKFYWNLAELIFQICRSLFWCQKWFLLNIYHLLGPNFSSWILRLNQQS